MQHAFRKAVHRTTEWRRRKKWDVTQDRESPAGRHESGSDEERFGRFASTVISIFNREGFCTYGSVRDSKGQDPRIYHALAKSGFAPQLLGVAVSKLIPLNFITKGPPGGSAKLPLHKRAEAAFRRDHPGERMTEADLLRHEKKEKLLAVLSRDGYYAGPKKQCLMMAEECNYDAPWLHEFLKGYQSPEDRFFKGQKPIKQTSGASATCQGDYDLQFREEELREAEGSDYRTPWAREIIEEHRSAMDKSSRGQRSMKAASRGTPAYRIDFMGATISRRMASYWLHHADFRECLKFLYGLLNHPAPRSPHTEGITAVDKELNQALHDYWTRRRASKSGN